MPAANCCPRSGSAGLRTQASIQMVCKVQTPRAAVSQHLKAAERQMPAAGPT
jgi:hypothetical protein